MKAGAAFSGSTESDMQPDNASLGGHVGPYANPVFFTATGMIGMIALPPTRHGRRGIKELDI